MCRVGEVAGAWSEGEKLGVQKKKEGKWRRDGYREGRQ